MTIKILLFAVCLFTLSINGLLGQDKTKDFAVRVLEGRQNVSDNNLTFACMDSLTSSNAQTRDFYWKVFKIILKKSDGALSEVVGGYGYNFLKKHPSDFIHKFEALDNTYKDKFINCLAYETSFMSETDAEIQALYKKIRKNCKNCTSEEVESLKKIEKKVLKATQSMRE